MGPRLDLVAVGSWTNFDHIFHIDKIPEPGETVQITSPIERIEAKTFGGCAPNNAAAAACLGFKAGLVSTVGQDFVTSGYQKYLQDLGVEQSQLILVEDGFCGHSFLFAAPNGETICISHTGAARRQTDFEPDARGLSNANSVVLNYLFDGFTLRAGQIAKNAGALVAVSGALYTLPNLVKDFIAITDVLFGTRFELGAVASTLGLKDVRGLLNCGVRMIFQTEGKRGSHIVTQEEEIDVPAVQAEVVVDTVGAGDAYVGAAVACLSRKMTAFEAAKVAATLASFVVEDWGCQTNLPGKGEFRKRYLKAWQEPAPEF